ncbi:hypothetical protein GBA52_006497 [Prunus armeniaca]|nr:hypothetical protein GBA52_006497 [Prunus armeniaca]
MEADLDTQTGEANSGPGNRARFDVAGFYEAIKPSKADAMLQDDMPDLLPELKPYQRRAAYWMVRREKGDAESLAKKRKLTANLKMYFSGSVSLHPQNSSAYVFGGILAGSLKTCIYEGVRGTSFSNTSVINISELISADIVLTTYDVLKEDLSHDSDRHEGTPIQRKLDDLYGLLRFLKACPFNASRWWVEVIRDPYEERCGAMEFTHKFFKKIMWRSSKAHVADELQLPPQEECLSWLTLSPTEEHFYQRQHETCVTYAREVIESLKDDILKENQRLLMISFPHTCRGGKLLNTLLKLRQACCHPQVGSSGLRSLQQYPMTMEEILMVLVGKTKMEGEEALRGLVVALNGLAGIAVIEQNFTQALSLYKEALALAEEHSEDFRLDPLLNIHIYHNLAEILALATNCCPSKNSFG